MGERLVGRELVGKARRRVDRRPADDVSARRVAHRIDREQEALHIDVAEDLGVLFELAIVGRDLVLPILVEVAANAGDDAIGVATRLLLAVAKIGRGAAETECDILVRADAIIVADELAGLRMQERVLRIEDLAVRTDRAEPEEERPRCVSEAVGANELGFDEGHEGGADLVMRQQVGAVTVEPRRKAELHALPSRAAVAADQARVEQVRAEHLARLGNQRAVGLEQIGLEIEVAVRPRDAAGDELAAIVEEGEADVLEIAVVGDSVARLVGIVDVDFLEASLDTQIGTLGRVPVLLVRIFQVDRDVAPPIPEIGACERADIIVARVAIFADAALAAKLDALEVPLEDEVDDARDRVRTVDGRVAARHDVDPLDQVRRDRVDVDLDGVAEDVRSDMAAAVLKRQRTVRAEPAQVEQVEARRAEEPAGVRLAERVAQRRKLVQHVADRSGARLEEFLAADRRHGHGRFQIGLADARPGDGDDLVLPGRILTGFQLRFALQGRGSILLCGNVLSESRRRKGGRQSDQERGAERCAGHQPSPDHVSSP